MRETKRSQSRVESLAAAATCLGIGEAIHERLPNGALPFAILGLALALWGGWVAMHL